MIVLTLPDIPTEDRLLVRARQGQADALREIYQQYFPPIFQYIRLRVDHLQEAEDLASEVFLKMLTAFQGRNAPQKSLRGWLFRVAKNVMYDHYGKTQTFTETTLGEWIPDTEDVDPEVQFIRSAGRKRTRQAVQELPFEQQEVIILRFGQMLSLKETADIIGKSTSAVKSLQFRGVNNLRRILDRQRTGMPDG